MIGGAALVALVGILKLQSQPQAQFSVLLALVLLYLAWALIHHILDKSLTLEVSLEYILTALLALIFFYGVLI